MPTKINPKQLAVQLAQSHTVAQRFSRKTAVLTQLKEHDSRLNEIYRYFANMVDVQRTVSYAGEWLLDNYYIVQHTFQQIKEALPPAYYRQLPKLGSSDLTGYPRVYALARAVVEFYDGRPQIDQTLEFIQAYQSETPLTIGELWAFPTMLRITIIEYLVYALAQYTDLPTDKSESQKFAELQADNSEDIVGNCIATLRLLNTQNWKEFYENASLVETILLSDPAKIYTKMDFNSKDLYRNAVEKLARAAKCPELEVAREAIWLADHAKVKPSPQPSPPKGGGSGWGARANHVGYWLVDNGRFHLEAHLDYRPSIPQRLRHWIQTHPAFIYFSSILILILLLFVMPFWYGWGNGATTLQLIAIGLFILLPAADIAVGLTNWAITNLTTPSILPRLDFKDGIPPEYRTVVVIPSLVTSADEIDALIHQMELAYLGNADPYLSFALLADFADAPERIMDGDKELLEQLSEGVHRINEKYKQREKRPFFLFFRDREWNPGENCWMGWERKRGKLVEFNRLLHDEENAYTIRIGDTKTLSSIRYVITLDADTELPRNGAKEMIATLAHPLNQAEFDKETGSIIAGYTVLQPRVEIRPTSANKSRFTRVFARSNGVDPYTLAVSDVYQDFFGEGSYVGKGIYDVEAFERSLDGRVPENALLSHDLFEGAHGRVGLVTDIILFEDYPPHYLAYSRRLHRWVRGDWQLLPWLRRRVPHADGGKTPNRLSLLNLWKMADNIRRSLLPPALVLFFLAGWVWLPGSAFFWTLLGLTVFAIPITTAVIGTLFTILRGDSIREAVANLRIDMIRWSLAIVFLLYEAIITLDAILSTLVRLFITKKRLLQWTTAAHTIRMFGNSRKLAVVWKQMDVATLLAFILGFVVALLDWRALPAALPLIGLWAASPWIAYWISRPTERKTYTATSDEQQELRRLARRTWLFFETFVGPDDHWLPPDHFQEDPRGLVAHRTSPTNIGLLLLSTLAAYDFGYMGIMNLILRLRSTIDGIDKLERYRGHLLNWYDTRNLEPLPPRYVSVVDSGNLAGCLLALQQGCLELGSTPVFSWQRWQGFMDTLDVLNDVIINLPTHAELPEAIALRAHVDIVRNHIMEIEDKPSHWAFLLGTLCENDYQQLEELLVALVQTGADELTAENLRELRIWAEMAKTHLYEMRDELNMLTPWALPMSQPPELLTAVSLNSPIQKAWYDLVETLPITPPLEELPAICREGKAAFNRLYKLLTPDVGTPAQVKEARAWCLEQASNLSSARMTAEGMLIGCKQLAAQAEKFFREMKFDFLFNKRRQLFHLGYNVSAERLDDNYYDLLASEARVTSLLAIATGEVPESHWMHLSRPVALIHNTRALLSWNGSMFEYLMPSLMVRRYEGMLLDQTFSAIVKRQIEYGKQKGVPWGISEAGYYAFDANLNYQYRGFGVPGLGFKRELSEDLVISPYASLIALSINPSAVLKNITHLKQIGMLAMYGFYESIDYTRSRLSLGQDRGVVRSFMAHHQGMIMLSLVNYLHDDTIIRRFHTDLRVESVDLLLQEKVPQQVPVAAPHPEETGDLPIGQARPQAALRPWAVSPDGSLPQVHYLSNGRYGVFITASGGGFSRWKERDLTRWRADTTLDNWGSWIYVQDRESGALWSVARQPTAVTAESQQVNFFAHKAEFFRRDHNVSLRMEIAVSPDDDVEARRVSLTSHSDKTHRLTLTSYSEIVLAEKIADRRHPAFNKLFIESEYLPELNCLLFRRRPRSAEETPIFLAHSLVVPPGEKGKNSYETDRARFLGRGQTARHPAIFESDGGLTETTGATLDQIAALSHELSLRPRSTTQLIFLTAAAESREEAIKQIRRYRVFHQAERIFDQARASCEIELRQFDFTAIDVERIQRLLSVLFYPHRALRAEAATLKSNRKGQSGLWPFAISGDYPILLAYIGGVDEIALINDLLNAHAYWRNRHIKVDLVILNLQDTGYSQELHNRLHRVIVRTSGEFWMNRRGGIFTLQADQLNRDDLVLLETAARAILYGSKGSLEDQLRPLTQQKSHLPDFVSTIPAQPTVEESVPLERPSDLLFDNGMGGFTSDGKEYVIYLENGRWTPAPWVNIIANPDFGFMVSETGGGYTWAINSGENRITPWKNDPVSDESGEALYLRDEETGEVWSPTPLPIRNENPYLVRHGAGYSIFEHYNQGIKQEVRFFVAPDAPVKIMRLRLENTWDRNRRITAVFYAEWALGASREVHQQFAALEFETSRHALLARNPYNSEFNERVAFVASNKEPHSLTADRAEFLGRLGGMRHPAALKRVGLSSAVETGLDPCAAIQIHVWLAPGETKEVVFLLGQGEDRQEALELIERFQNEAEVERAWEENGRFWEKTLGAITVETPDPAMNLLLNRWLLYQSLTCRMWGRSGFYQSSGAYGYRDQLQDVMAFIHSVPHIARDHILQAARHQFKDGDVLHWWHPPSGRGVRTRCSDDLLWLPYVVSHYVETTGDSTILNERIPYLRGAPLEAHEHERYGQYETTARRYSLYDHCCQALEKGMTAGEHGLPLIGSHDWNDGLSRVGIEGKGESVWLGWFLYATLERFTVVCEQRGDTTRADDYRRQAEKLQQALEQNGWDGEWYRRGYYDDGSPLGSQLSDEAKIDSIAQSWAVLSGAADGERARLGMTAVNEKLIREEDKLLLLFAPPFDKTKHDPGYIKGYLPGIRENGGQYTHAALWTVWAFAELGDGERAEELFRLLNPIYHSDTAEKLDRYRVEPYVVAADVYSVPPHVGRGGWTWYTGSASWMYRVGVEAILGIERRGDTLQINPQIPQSWPAFCVVYRYGDTLYEIEVENGEGDMWRVELEKRPLTSNVIPLIDSGQTQHVLVTRYGN